MANLQGFFIMVPVFGFLHPFAGLLSISNASVSCCSSLWTRQLPKDTVPESNTTPTKKSPISWQQAARNSPRILAGLVFAGRTPHHWLCVAARQPHQ